MKNKHKALLALALFVALMCGAEAKSCRLTFSGYEGAETLKDFPALVKIPDGLAGFDYRDSTADGSDLAFFGADGQPLAYEIDTWDPEGESYVRVRVAEQTKATKITAWWGGARKGKTASVQQQGVWADDYMGVWHFSKFKKGVTKDSKYGPVPRWPKGPDDKDMLWVQEKQSKEFSLQDCVPKDYPVMIGEFGCVACGVTHESALKFMASNMEKWRSRGYGWAIWDYDGPFGFVESSRPDAEYIEVMGRKVDRKMLELLRAK